MLTFLRRFLRRLRPRSVPPDIQLHGRHSPDWTKALGKSAPVWRHLAGFGWGARKRVVIPLLEIHVASMPAGCWALVPDTAALSAFADKQAFARYVAEHGLTAFVPRPVDPDAPYFPAVLKRTDLNGGKGIAVVASPAELDAHLAQAPWAGHPVLLQELIENETDYVAHLVCARGRIVWHCTYAYDLASRRTIRGPASRTPTRRASIAAADLRVFEKFLRPLAFDGPANIDFRRRPDGSLAIFEINPRLGGSLMRPDNVRDLAGALRAIIRHAKWRPQTATGRAGQAPG